MHMLAKAGAFMEKIGVNKAPIPYISPHTSSSMAI